MQEPITEPPDMPDESAAPETVPETAPEKTGFGAIKSPGIGGKHRYPGLILVGSMVLLFALIGLWSAFLEDDAPAPAESTPAESTPAENTPVEITPQPAPQVDAQAAPDLPLSSGKPGPGVVKTGPAATARSSGPAIPLAGPTAPDLTAVLEDMADTQPDLPAAPSPAPPSNLPPLTARPLPDVSAETLQDSPAAVIPAGDGVAMPDGFTQFAGTVADAPAPRPDAVRQTYENARPPPLKPGDTFEALPTLEQFRPRLRPDRIASEQSQAPTATAAPTQAAAPDPQLAGFRPIERPARIVEESQAAATAAEPEADPFEGATALAATAAIKPPEKPDNFAARINSALAAAIAADTTSASIAIRPDELDEPEPGKTAPRLPTSASVATQATRKTAINLRKINLVGLYGASGKQRALVRLANGRFVKVSVGDRLDGGQVIAIGNGQLTYRKGARDRVLKLLESG